jgi:hypothetical protein
VTAYRDDKYFFSCRHCGRTWNAAGMGTASRATWDSGRRIGANTGFVASASSNHEDGCATKTPEQRRKTNERDERRWRKSPPVACRIRNDPTHPGLAGAAENAGGTPPVKPPVKLSDDFR